MSTNMSLLKKLSFEAGGLYDKDNLIEHLYDMINETSKPNKFLSNYQLISDRYDEELLKNSIYERIITNLPIRCSIETLLTLPDIEFILIISLEKIKYLQNYLAERDDVNIDDRYERLLDRLNELRDNKDFEFFYKLYDMIINIYM